MAGADPNLFNGVACIFWSGFLLASLYRQKIPYSRHASVVRGESPRLFWVLVAANAAVIVWTGLAFALHRA
jgi:hypothetical protein